MQPKQVWERVKKMTVDLVKNFSGNKDEVPKKKSELELRVIALEELVAKLAAKVHGVV
jgi:hypothetical protein